MNLPPREELIELVEAVQADIQDDYRTSLDQSMDESMDEPGQDLTVGIDLQGESGRWNYQTGDNSYTGGAYSFPDWAVVYVYRDSDPAELADDILAQFGELSWQRAM